MLQGHVRVLGKVGKFSGQVMGVDVDVLGVVLAQLVYDDVDERHTHTG